MIGNAARPGMLASVANLDEAVIAVAAGVDLVDLKNPAHGALGAWEIADVRAAVEQFGKTARLSATIGDLPSDPALLLEAAARMAETGVDIVKIGLFAATPAMQSAAVAALASLAAKGVAMVAVLMADQSLHLPLLADLARAGFKGAMLDTADKASGPLLAHRTTAELSHFLAELRALGMLSGLAGSLRAVDIPPLSALRPDYLGFRGALCAAGRTSGLDRARLAAVHQAVRAAASLATATAGKQVAMAAGETSDAGIRAAAAR